MAGDLGTDGSEVHAKAQQVLDFWFDEVSPDKWFAKDEVLDETISRRFRELQDDLLATGANGWRDDAETLLAAVIVADQFSRNLHRGDPLAYAGDPLAQTLARLAIAKGWDRQIDADRRRFLYLPLMHSEEVGAQAESVQLYETLGDEEWLGHARTHANVLQRFGRFPQRNAALKQKSTPDELEFLSQPGVDW